jgi:transcriptional regulator with XRE-family HTH domain
VGDVRYKKGVSLRQLAQQAQISKSYLQRIEGGEAAPSLEIMVRIARALNVSLDKLYRDG